MVPDWAAESIRTSSREVGAPRRRRCFTDHVAGIYVGGLPQRWPRGPGGKSVNRRPPGRRVDPRFLQGRPQMIRDLQALAGNAAVSRLLHDRDLLWP